MLIVIRFDRIFVDLFTQITNVRLPRCLYAFMHRCLVAFVPCCLYALNLRHAKTGYCYKAWHGGHN